MRVNISWSKEFGEQVKSYCKENGYKLSTLLQQLMRERIESVNKKRLKQVERLIETDPEPDSSQGQKLVELATKVEKTEEALYPGPIKGICKNCNSLKTVSPHEFIFGYDMERITDLLCETCWSKAKQDGSAR